MVFRPDRRLWDGTRGRILQLLRRGDQSANELAKELKLTTSGVRAHLAGMEGDGLVRRTGKRPGLRKPIVTYGLAPAAERLFPRPYARVLGCMLDVLKARTSPPELAGLMQAIGRRLASDLSLGTAGRVTAVDQALAVLKEFGGFCEGERKDGVAVLACSDCPLAAVAEGRPEVCALMETVLTEATGVRVRQRCRPEPTPQCRFEIDADGLHTGQEE